MSELFDDLRWRGLVHQVTDDELGKVLDNDSLSFYHGVDPTADSLAIHHLVGLLALRRLAEAGHRPIALVGGGTGSVGDPSGKSDERRLLEAQQLEANVASVRPQIERIVGSDVTVVNNADWLGQLSVIDFLRDVGKLFSVNEMIRKESVRARLEGREQGISFTEFSYMLLQAYDFLHLYREFDCRLQIGGSDQWGNITEGVDLIRRLEGGSAYGLTWPLVTKADGSKFGKTESGNLWLDPARTSPYALYQALVRVDDEVVGKYLRIYTFLPRDRIEDLDAATAERPEQREAQRELAHQVVALVHGEDAAAGAERAAAALFTEAIADLDEASLLDVMAEAPSASVATGSSIVDALCATGLTPSKSAAQRALQQGGVYVNNAKQATDRPLARDDALHGRYVVLRRGKRDHSLVRLEG